MNIPLPQAVFLFLAAVIVVCSILTVTTKRILRSATYLLFVLFATAGIYFELNYSFLGAVQLTVYAGGIIVLYVFSILLTSSDNKKADKIKNSKFFAGNTQENTNKETDSCNNYGCCNTGCGRRCSPLYLHHTYPLVPGIAFRTR